MHVYWLVFKILLQKQLILTTINFYSYYTENTTRIAPHSSRNENNPLDAALQCCITLAFNSSPSISNPKHVPAFNSGGDVTTEFLNLRQSDILRKDRVSDMTIFTTAPEVQLRYLCSSAKRELSFRYNRVFIRALIFEWFSGNMSDVLLIFVT